MRQRPWTRGIILATVATTSTNDGSLCRLRQSQQFGSAAAFSNTQQLHRHVPQERNQRICYSNQHSRAMGVPSLMAEHRRTTPDSTTSTTTGTSEEENVARRPNKMGPKQGVYSRPSGAIERGSGFFVPGLEGPKVRLVFGTVLLGLTAYNHVVSTGRGGDAVVVVSEGLTIVYSLLVLLQGAVEYRKDAMKQEVIIGRNQGTGNIRSYQQLWSMPVNDDVWRQRVEWVATTYLSLTPASHMMLIGPGKILYSLGLSEPRQQNDNTADACQAALNTLAKSKSGRVALPPQHPAVVHLCDNNYQRCVVLQIVDDDDDDNNNNNNNLCWLMSSDKLLAAFSSQDLEWLGRLAVYTNPKKG